LIAGKVIFWDWNGTLLDDVDICIDSMNAMLSRRNMKTIDFRFYTEVFGFPVIDYYMELGFDFSVESFEDLSVEFIAEYNSRVEHARLHNSVIEVLENFKNRKFKQVIVSAMEQQMLIKLLEKHSLYNYFDDVRGLENIYAGGKVHLAQAYIDEHKINPKDILLIGDTVHDAEVAKEIGSELVLFTNGHHSVVRLKAHSNFIIQDLFELINLVN